jgi:hypothetical protein
MARSIKGSTGRFISATGRPDPLTHARVFAVRVPAGGIADKLGAMKSGDRGDFLRAAIAEKLERDQVLSKQEY